MSQDWVANLYTTGTTGDTTLSNMELMFATLRSSFSGSAAPSNAVDGNVWYDTDTDLLKAYRNAAWAGVLVGSAAFKMWVYLNAAEDGWAIDAASVVDRVLAFKGGSQAYNANGGTNAGTWVYSGLTKDAHTHLAGTLLGPSHTHPVPFSGWSHTSAGSSGYLGVLTGTPIGDLDIANANRTSLAGGTGSVTGSTGAQSDAAISSDGNHRPAGAIGTLQYPNMT